MLKYFVFALTALALMCPECNGQTLPTTEENTEIVADEMDEFQPDEETDDSGLDSDDMTLDGD